MLLNLDVKQVQIVRANLKVFESQKLTVKYYRNAAAPIQSGQCARASGPKNAHRTPANLSAGQYPLDSG